MDFKIRLLQQLSKVINKVNSTLFSIPPPPDVTKLSEEDVNKYYKSIAQKRLPHLFIEKVEILGSFFYDSEKLKEFITMFHNKELSKFSYNKEGFEPFKDYASVLKAIGGNDTYIIVDVQYFDYTKDEEMVFCEKLIEPGSREC